MERMNQHLWLSAFVWLALNVAAVAQELYQPNPEEVSARVAAVLRFYQLNASAPELAQLVALQMRIETPSTSMRDRWQANQELYRLLYRLHGVTTPPDSLVNTAGTSTGILGTFLASGPVKPLGPAITPWGQLGRIEQHGRGPVPMILVAPAGFDGTIYRTFMERNASRYTMYAVTLPGSGKTPLLAESEHFNPAATPWWTSAQQGVLALIAQHKLDKPVIIGLQSSTYLAARLALDHPGKVRAAVMICGLAHTPQPSEQEPDRPMTLEERRQSISLRVNALVTDLWPRVVLATRAGGEQLLQAFLRVYPPGLSRNPQRNNELFLMSALDSSLRAMRYGNELAFTDLGTEFGKLRVPVLAITADHDDASTQHGTPDTAQWTEVKLRYPTIPLTISRFENSRTFVTDDAPTDLDAAVAAFLAGQPVEIKRARAVAVRPSPRASVRQQIELTEITIEYGRPQVKGREIWGKLVPWRRVWRAGANEATRITFNRDLLIEGRKLAAGEYSFFVVPDEREWTVIFNRVAHQWGAFNYNPEFDALRVPVNPQNTAHVEWLSFDIIPTDKRGAHLMLRWEKLQLALHVEATP